MVRHLLEFISFYVLAFLFSCRNLLRSLHIKFEEEKKRRIVLEELMRKLF